MDDHQPHRQEQDPPGSEPPAAPFLSNEQAWTAIVIGLVLLVALYAMSRPNPPPSKSDEKAADNVTRLLPEMVPLVTGEEPIKEIFTRAGCPVCHQIPGIPGADGRVGPALLLGTTGPQRLADPGYHGRASTVREYVVESILSPAIYIVPGFPDGAMPRWYGKKLSATALEKIAAYVEQLKVPSEGNGRQ